jgi:hypothetical protein
MKQPPFILYVIAAVLASPCRFSGPQPRRWNRFHTARSLTTSVRERSQRCPFRISMSVPTSNNRWRTAPARSWLRVWIRRWSTSWRGTALLFQGCIKAASSPISCRGSCQFCSFLDSGFSCRAASLAAGSAARCRSAEAKPKSMSNPTPK